MVGLLVVVLASVVGSLRLAAVHATGILDTLGAKLQSILWTWARTVSDIGDARLPGDAEDAFSTGHTHWRLAYTSALLGRVRVVDRSTFVTQADFFLRVVAATLLRGRVRATAGGVNWDVDGGGFFFRADVDAHMGSLGLRDRRTESKRHAGSEENELLDSEHLGEKRAKGVVALVSVCVTEENQE